VVNRLSTFTRLTGLDVTVPEQAALALVALQTIPD
jgi:DNA-binding PucR family transcriptional regulator